MVWYVVSSVVLGLLAVAAARSALPLDRPGSLPGMLLIGLAGAFLGGVVGYLTFGHSLTGGRPPASGVVGSAVGAVVAVVLYWAAVGRGGRSDGAPRAGSRRGRAHRPGP